MKKPARLKITGFLYRNLLKPLLFLFPAEMVHNNMTDMGELLGSSPLLRKLTSSFFAVKYYPSLATKAGKLHVSVPIGLAAGFDYEAKLSQIGAAIGFGYQTIGTVTNLRYDGNAPPRLARLPKSRSLLVNKGFKSPGVNEIISKLIGKEFPIPVGISIGRSNVPKIETIDQAILDIIFTFQLFESAQIRNSYYELNISCPNLHGNVDFYHPSSLKKLLFALTTLQISKPIFIKMPIDKTDEEFLDMLQVIVKYPITGIIVGNLLKDRKNPTFDKKEIKRATTGNFSGKPTEQRSNELISLTYKKYKSKLVIIGCGGIFSAEDALKKIELGATMVQLITGMVFNGPQLISEMNHDLVKLLRKKGYSSIKEAVGASYRRS